MILPAAGTKNCERTNNPERLSSWKIGAKRACGLKGLISDPPGGGTFCGTGVARA
jgi:hypothetical protein